MASHMTKINGKNNSGKGKDKGKGKGRAKETQAVSHYHLELSAEYLRLTLYRDALRCASRALELEPHNLVARMRRAKSRKHLGLLEAALADVETVLSVEPTFSIAREIRDEIHLAKQKTREEDVQPAAKADSSDLPARNEAKDDNDTSNSSDDDTDFESDEEDDILVNSEVIEQPPPSKVVDYTLPHYHPPSPPQTDESSPKQTPHNELDHIGNGTACRFYNHNGCNRGATCTFSHAPDSKSIRDERGKNVCLYHLIGKCKWDSQSCIYSHSKTFLSTSVPPTSSLSIDSISDSPAPNAVSASFAPFSSTAATRPPDGDPEGWWNNPERTALIRDLVLKRDENGRLAHEARVASFNERQKSKRTKKGLKKGSKTAPSPSRELDALFSNLRLKYYNDSEWGDSEYSFDTDLDQELEMEQTYLNGGFTDDEMMELLCQGVKPWDDDAGMVLAALSGNYW